MCIRCADKSRPQFAGHRIRHPFLPEKGMSAPRAEFCEPQLRPFMKAFDLAPDFRFGLRVKNIKLELVERGHCGARAQFADDSERVDFPHRHFGPCTGEGQDILAVDRLQLIVGQAEGAQIIDVLRTENVAAAVEAVAGQPDQLVFAESKRAAMIELRAQNVFRNDRSEPDFAGAVDEAERHRHLRIKHPDKLVHQELVEVRIEQRPDDRIEPVVMVMHAGREIHHDQRDSKVVCRRHFRQAVPLKGVSFAPDAVNGAAGREPLSRPSVSPTPPAASDCRFEF